MAHDFDEPIEGELVKSSSDQGSMNLAILRMENETIMSAAQMRPRDSLLIVQQLTALIEAYPAAAEEAVYSRPVGSVQEVTCSKCQVKYESSWVTADTTCPACESPAKRDQHKQVKKTKFAEGLSIRAAESIRSIFGFTRLAVTNEMLPNGSIKITGTLVDYSAGNLTSDERIVSPYYKSKDGAMVRHPEDRFLNVVVKAEKSKLKRDIILDSVPGIIKALFRDECEKKMLALVSPELIEQKVIPAFAEFGITLQPLAALLGRKLKMGWKEEDRLQLRKILAGLKNGETNAKDLLADIAGGTEPAGEVKKVSPKTLNDVADAAVAKQPVQGDGEITFASVAAQIADTHRAADVEALRKEYTGPEGGFTSAESSQLESLCEQRVKFLSEPAGKQGNLLDKGSEQSA